MPSALRTVRWALARVLVADRAAVLRLRVAAAFWPRAEAALRCEGVRADVVRADAVAGLRVRVAGLRVTADSVVPVDLVVVLGV